MSNIRSSEIFCNAFDVFEQFCSASDYNATLQLVLQRQEGLLVSVILLTSGGFNLRKLVKQILTSGFLSLTSLKASFIVNTFPFAGNFSGCTRISVKTIDILLYLYH